MSEWQPIETCPRTTQYLLCHSDKKWVRFGRWFTEQREWYYSGTSERSQWAQVKGDEPTHWMPLPEPPTGGRDGI